MGRRVKRLGVVGTMVWDTIILHGERRPPFEEWGGISYALAALEVELPQDWEIVPLVKVGRDLADRANTFLQSLTRRSGACRFIEVPEANNRVTLRYVTGERRSEQLRGRVPPWTWAELAPLVRDLDAIYVNFISGFELDLAAAQHLRATFDGPIYADLHSLLLGLRSDGMRVPRPLPDVERWFACFDVVQLNEDELGLIGGDPMEIAARAMAQGVRLMVVTLGKGGAVYFAGGTFRLFERSRSAVAGPLRTRRIPARPVPHERDPTGCGDVFGATLLAHLIGGDDVEGALAAANRLAARNAAYRGASHLQHHLRGAIVSA